MISHARRALRTGPLRKEPRNEQGVVALFAGICEERFGLKIEDIETGFPDCEAIRLSNGRKVWIEFEFESSRFDHHDRWWACDWVVCWVDNANRGETWRRGTPKRKGLRVVELRKEFPELGPDVWVQPYRPENVARLDERKNHREWTVPSKAGQGDLLLVYRSTSDQGLTHVLEVRTPAEHDPKHGRGTNYTADLRTVLKLPNPVPADRLREAWEDGYFRRPSPLGASALHQWPAIRELLLEFNPRAGVAKALRSFEPPRAARSARPIEPT